MKCFNPKVLGGLALTALAVFLVAPGTFSTALPFLVALACPLSMVLMMRGMSGGKCRSRGSEANQEHQTGATDAAPSMSAAEAEIARLRAEVDQLKAEQGARAEADPAIDTRASDGRQ